MESEIIAREWYGTHQERLYFIDYSKKLAVSSPVNKTYSSLEDFFRAVFLPQGYPHSVSEDYLAYQIWDTIQAFASSISNSLATKAILTGVGVGDEEATAVAATITWLLKDGTSMVGRIMFAWSKGSSLDADCKRWRLFADVLLDTAICVDLISALLPREIFRYIVCVSGVCKAIVGVAGGATRAALTQHQARRNNMADVSAKDGSQETLVNLAALLVSLVLIPLVADKQMLIWTLFFLCACLHIYANYKAVTSIIMETPNQARFHHVVTLYLSWGDVTSVKEANRRESVTFGLKRPFKVKLGQPLSAVVYSHSDFVRLKKLYDYRKYLLWIDTKNRWINIVLRDDSTHEDWLEALFQAEVVLFILGNLRSSTVHAQTWKPVQQAIQTLRENKGMALDVDYLVRVSLNFAHVQFPVFLKEFQSKGWWTHQTQLGADEWRANWS